jgi:hypothetical protein
MHEGTKKRLVDDFPIDQIARTFDELIEAHELMRATERSLEEYMKENVPPEVPEVFENIEALLRYNAQRERYERGLGGMMELRADRAASYERVASRVELLLPEGTRLIHAYGGSSADILEGKRYVIFKESVLTTLSAEGTPLETASGETSAVSYVVRVEEMGTTGPE